MSNPLTEAVDDVLNDGRPDDGRESIDNRERGCGHLNPSSCYVRSDVGALSAAGGEIPRFVELDEPVEYREHTGKGAIIPGFVNFPGVSFGLHYEADGRTTTPEDDIHDHVGRLKRHGFDGDHFGSITSASAHDLLMSVGKTNYATPDEYIDECRDRGLNLKIPISDRQEPPTIEPLRTRVWVIHPHGAGEDRPGIIGYAYLTRAVFTTGTKATADDPDIPAWAEDYAAAGKVDVVDRGEPIAEDDKAHDKPSTTLRDFEVDRDAADEATVDDQPDPADPALREDETPPERDTAELARADPDAADDVSSVQIEFGRGDIPVTDRVASIKEGDDGTGLSYNTLKLIAARRDDVDVGSTPSKEDLIHAIAEDAYGYIPEWDNGGETGGDA